MPEVKVDNLEAEMKRNKISRSDIANLLGLSYRTIHSRFNGESEWGYAECVKVRDAYFPNMTLDYLFENRRESEVRAMKKKIINKRVNGDSEELHALKGFKVLAVGNGTIGEECALSIMLMNENNVAVDLSITDDGAYLSDFYALTEDMIPRTYDD